MYFKNPKGKIVILGLLYVLNSVDAKDLGVNGTVYSISEPDLLHEIQAQVLNVKQAQWHADFQQPASFLTRTQQSHVWLLDPADHQSNSLHTFELKKALIFYDANDEEQVHWVQQMDKTLQGNDKLILVSGSIRNQMQLFKKSIYFDQGGLLVNRFQLQHVPTIITQEGNRLRIQEVAL